MSTGLAELTDEQLIVSCRGAEDARARVLVGELARRHFERVTGFIHALVDDAAVAQDLAQEAFVRVYAHRDAYRDIGRFSTWMFTIARNLALNEVRNRRLRPALTLDGTRPTGSGPMGAVVPADAPAPADEAARGDLRAAVRRAIEALDEHHRVVVVLCDIEERPYAEAAEVLGVPVGTIRSRLSRAREQLERRLRGVLGEGQHG
ncbi:MAG: sigma-70 family RNA polymerase sigma factor [Planctomycetes bacterium]|nr:sigma-70 family RNA polymerase sigma factor [Planctomycetota bacterium]